MDLTYGRTMDRVTLWPWATTLIYIEKPAEEQEWNDISDNDQKVLVMVQTGRKPWQNNVPPLLFDNGELSFTTELCDYK